MQQRSRLGFGGSCAGDPGCSYVREVALQEQEVAANRVDGSAESDQCRLMSERRQAWAVGALLVRRTPPTFGKRTVAGWTDTAARALELEPLSVDRSWTM